MTIETTRFLYTNVTGTVILDKIPVAESSFHQWLVYIENAHCNEFTEVTSMTNGVDKVVHCIATSLHMGNIKNPYDVVIENGYIVLKGTTEEVVNYKVYRNLSEKVLDEFTSIQIENTSMFMWQFDSDSGNNANDKTWATSYVFTPPTTAKLKRAWATLGVTSTSAGTITLTKNGATLGTLTMPANSNRTSVLDLSTKPNVLPTEVVKCSAQFVKAKYLTVFLEYAI